MRVLDKLKLRGVGASQHQGVHVTDEVARGQLLLMLANDHHEATSRNVDAEEVDLTDVPDHLPRAVGGGCCVCFQHCDKLLIELNVHPILLEKVLAWRSSALSKEKACYLSSCCSRKHLEEVQPIDPQKHRFLERFYFGYFCLSFI